MSWVISLSIGESFADLTAQDEATSHSLRWYLPSQPPEKCVQSLSEHLGSASIKEVRVSPRWGAKILRQGLGAPPAILVTSGFEHWLEMNAPVSPQSYSLHPRRQLSMIDPNLIFPMNERLDADGKVVRPVASEDLEYMASKLEMMERSHIAVTYLHSNKNPEHEIQTGQFLRERGFLPRLSSQLSNEGQERPRWWRAILSAYMAPVLDEVVKDWATAFANVLEVGEEKILIHDEASWRPWKEEPCRDWVASHFTEERALHQKLSRHKDQFGKVLYFGIEEFLLFDLKEAQQRVWDSPVGPVAVNHPPVRPLNLQPTSMVEPSPWGNASFDHQIAGYEPGPMSMGRGVKPLFLDLLYIHTQQDWPVELANRFNSHTNSRIKETLSAMSRSSSGGGLEAEEIVEGLLRLAFEQIINEVLPSEKVTGVCGPLAPVMQSLFAKYRQGHLFKTAEPPDFRISQSLLNLDTSIPE